MTGDDVKKLQKFMLTICKKFKNIPGIRVSGVFDELMESSILKLQKDFGIEETGAVGPILWYDIVEYSKK